MTNNQGGLTTPLFHCIFNGSESITGFMHETKEELVAILPHLYAVCLTNTAQGSKQVLAGFVVKTSFTHHDAGFLDALNGLVSSIPSLSRLRDHQSTLLPARIEIKGTEPLSEEDLSRLMVRQFVRHSVGGNA
jgi:hypothetical protein